MKNLKNFFRSPVATVLAFVIAAGLLTYSGIGTARAAFADQSDRYTTEIELYDIGVTLNENGSAVASRTYSNNAWTGNESGELLTNLIPEDQALKLDTPYTEKLTVSNSGSIDEFVRLTIYRSWVNKDGKTERTLSPDLINLSYLGTSLDEADAIGNWVKDPTQTTKERLVFYYTKKLASGETTDALTDQITIKDEVTQAVSTRQDGNTIYTEYDYNGVQFSVEARVDAVQDHNAQDAIESAWGRQVAVSGDTLRLR